MSPDLITVVRELVEAALAPVVLEVVDESGAHVGHAGARGGGHLRVTVVAAQFTGLSRIQRQRLIHNVLRALLASGQLHALALSTYAPDEWALRGTS